jgi:2'-5' RNA ligase
VGNPVNAGNEKQRIFIAAWPDATVRAALHDIAKSIAKTHFRAKAVKPQNYHATVAFLGELVPPAIETIKQRVSDFSLSQVILRLDRLGFWRKPKVVWLGCNDTPATLSCEIEGLCDQLRRLGFHLDEREFVPHVTLFRKAARRPRVTITPIDWTISHLVVVRSTLTPDGADYEIIATSNQ